MPQKAQMVAQVDATSTVTNNRMEITAVIQGLKTCPDQLSLSYFWFNLAIASWFSLAAVS